MQFFRRIRGLVGISLMWGVAISALGTAFIVTAIAARWLPPIPGLGWTQWVAQVTRVATRDFVAGCVSGAAFAMLLAGAERRRNVDGLSLSRVGLWGFLAAATPIAIAAKVSGAVIPPVAFAVGIVAAGVIGAGLGVGMVRLARRGAGSLAADRAVSTG